ncbi:type II toxin-antitoxin system HicB family antitoxin [Acinetobacter sp.]|uniref:type II toxin-antitoxin system HicB family antitoxin n=1 Tax=Acinetobacter sp. TaxID=472 RepID=UPI0026474780|nr:type II toxin-antitoxin system HicB family antitoxin [Acinetobacter sp.]MDN5511162.1 type II toxin-antitoxin system HicB family antitoxin [Acinetobacter sp.]MDN5523945.1 type II toxin-antitoxin system HicB family antitoxin [Acinetobacter sp.]
MLYPIAVEKGSDTEAYGVVVPDIPGCFSAGDTFEEALDNIKEAIAGHLEILAEDGEDIPLASEVGKFVGSDEFNGFIWAVVDVDVSRYLGKAEKVNVTLPSRLIRMIDDKVGKDRPYKSRSAFLAAGAEKMLHA